MKRMQIFTVSPRFLKIVAALVWYIGGFILLRKGISLLFEANLIQPDLSWPWIAGFVGIFLGVVKAKYLFARSIKKNLSRIEHLSAPKIWQFFSPGFFAALSVMILAGVILSRMAHDNYLFSIIVSILDLGIGTALLASSYVYWTEKAFTR